MRAAPPASTPGTAPATPRPAGAHRLCPDGRRAIIAIAVSMALPAAAGFAFAAVAPSDADTTATTVVMSLLGWNTFVVVVYSILTVRTFGGVERAEFEARMAARTPARTAPTKRIDWRGDGPTFAIESAIVAFGVVLVLPHVNAIRVDDWLLVPVTISILLSCWVLAIVSYALHYAQRDLEEPGLEFPGDRTNAFGDYAYFSIAVATTFGATDVNVTTARMRRVVNVHTILTFVYNSVIVALLAALLVR